MSKRIVIALGGNALGSTPYEQLELVRRTAKPIVDLIEAGNEVIIAHGNGPQVGMINLGMSTAAEAKAINAAISGKGGGRSTMIQGSCTAKKAQLEAYFAERDFITDKTPWPV